MLRKPMFVVAVVMGLSSLALTAGTGTEGTQELQASPGQTLKLDLDAGGSVKITGGSSGVSVSHSVSGRDAQSCRVEVEKTADGVEIKSRWAGRRREQSANVELEIRVPSRFNVELDSMGGSLQIEGVEGTFRGKTMGGGLTLRHVKGEARLRTMGGAIELTDSELDGSLKTMGGKVLFENVVGDVKGSSMGGNVRYKNVVRRGGDVASPASVGGKEATPETVQISTMGGDIDVDEAPEGAALHTMGGNIRVSGASRFVSAKTMGGDIDIDSVDGWVKATTMGGDLDVEVTGSGGDVVLQSMSGNITLVVPSDFSMQLDLEIAYTRNSSRSYEIITDVELQRSDTKEWDHDHGSPRRYIRAKGSVEGGNNRVKLRTINGNIEVKTAS